MILRSCLKALIAATRCRGGTGWCSAVGAVTYTSARAPTRKRWRCITRMFTPDSLSRLLRAVGFETREVRHSLVPTYWIVSARYALERRFGRRWPFAFLSTANPLCLAASLPITMLEQLAATSARFTIVAVRTPRSSV